MNINAHSSSTTTPPPPPTDMYMSLKELLLVLLYRVAQKECNTYDQWFQQNKGQNKQAFSNQMTPRSLILMKAFGFYGRFSEAMSFSKFATSVSKVTIYVPKISIVCLPGESVCSCFVKMKTARIKRSIRYVILHCYNPGKALKESWLLIQKKQILKLTLLQKNGSRIKTFSSKSLNLVSFSWKKNVLRIYAFTNFGLVPDFFEISDRRCCILSGPPCILCIQRRR